MMEVLHFTGIFLITNVVFGGVAAAFLLGHNDRLQVPEWPLALVGFAMGPFLVTLVLYYSMALWHGIPHLLLQCLPILAFTALAMAAGVGWSRIWALLKKTPTSLRDRSLWPFLLGSAFLLVVSVLFLLNKPLVDHDVLEYGIQGRVFLRERAIVYQRFHFDATNGFHYVGLHGFSFPLLFTWEGLTNTWLDHSSDLWVRSITMWYGWLLIAFVWAVMRRIGRWAAVAGGIALTAPMGFLFLVTIYHLDSYRIFFFSAAVAAFVLLLQVPSRSRLLLFAALCGAQAFIHSIGAILAGVMLLAVLLFLGMPYAQRLRYAVRAVGVMLAFGAVHYVVDVFRGTGWIFQDIIWY